MERHYDDGTEPTILPHMRCCHGPCQQGRKPCPTPDACELQEPVCSDGLELLGIASIAVALLALMVVLLAICL